MKLNGTLVAIKVDDAAARTPGGVILPSDDKANTGVVKALGVDLLQAQALRSNGMHETSPVSTGLAQVGDKVIFNSALNQARNLYKLGGEELLLIENEEIKAVLD